MIVKVTQENLHAALNATARIASGRNALPILSNVLVHTKDKSLYLTATNLELAISVRVAAKVEEAGMLALPARLLNDYVSSLNKGTLTLTSAKKHAMHISADNNESVVNGADPDEFPSIPAEAEGEKVSIAADKLKTALAQTIVATSTDEARQALTGIYLHADQEGTFVVATDSYRLAEKKLEGEKISGGRIIPFTTMQEVLRNLEGGEEKAELTLSDNQAVFKIGAVTIISRLIDGKYPDYRQIIPKSSEATAELDRDELINTARVAALFARETSGSVVVTLDEKEQLVKIESVTSQAGENTSSAPAKIKGESQISLNSRYLIDALQVMDGELVEFQISGKHSPCVLRPKGSKDYTHLIMPLKS